MAGMSTVAEVGDKIILANTSPKEDIRLHTICTGARQLFQRGDYTQAFTVLLHRGNWSQLSLVQYHYWLGEVWHLMWDIATRRYVAVYFYLFAIFTPSEEVKTVSNVSFWSREGLLHRPSPNENTERNRRCPLED
jgi:hypothetical protein